MTVPEPDEAELAALWPVLGEILACDERGRGVLARLQGTPEQAAPLLTGYLAAQRDLPARLRAIVVGGYVDKLVMVGSARDVHVHVPMPQPTALAQLPAAPRGFIGREAELSAIRGGSATADGLGGGPVIVVICGPPGMGKSALALVAAHELTAAAPDGQFHLALRGTSPSPMSTAEALRQLLGAFGLRENLPRSVDERAALFRTLTAHRRCLLVLDDAASEAQVTQLLPSSSHALVLVTSRNPLATLDAVLLLRLDSLSPKESMSLLAAQLGPARVNAEQVQAAELSRICAGLPLALRIVAARLRARPHWQLAELVDQLRDERSRLVELTSGELAVAASFQVSYRSLETSVARTFRLLGLLRGEQVDRAAVAVLVGHDETTTRRMLAQLMDAHLVEGKQNGRYGLHDLLRLYAREQAAVWDTGPEREAALSRMIEYYLAEANEWARQAPSEEVPAQGALEWYAIERTNLLSTVEQAVELKQWPAALGLVGSLRPYLEHRGDHEDRDQVFALAARAAAANKDPAGEVHALVHRAAALRDMAHLPEAEPLYRKALALLDRYDLGGHKSSWVHTHFGDWWLDQGRTREALAEYEQALRAAEPTGDQQHIAWIRVHMSDADCAAGLPDRALDRLAEAQNVARANDDAGSEAWISVHRSVALRLADRFGEAERALRDALGYYESANDVQGIAWALTHLGDMYRVWRRPVEAIDTYRQLHTVAVHLDNSRLSKFATSVLTELDGS